LARVEGLLRVIRENLALLDSKLEECSEEELVGDPFYLNSVLHILQVTSQALIDLASHVIAESGLGVVDRYSAAPEILRERGVLERGEAETFRKIIGLRNIVVHGYSAVSREVVLSILRGRKYRDIIRLALRVAEWAAGRGVDP